MNTNLTQCPNCQAKLGGILGSNYLISARGTEILNMILKKNSDAYCGKCSESNVKEVRDIISKEEPEATQEIKEGINLIPVVSIHVPPKWDFEAIGFVTGQSTTGTGVIAEFLSSWTDAFGQQSKTYNAKLRQGENICLEQIKWKAVELNCNAIVGLDIDYSEVGGGKGMLMVCMTGTAVKLKNIDEINTNASEKISKIKRLSNNSLVFEEFRNVFFATTGSGNH